MKKILKIYIRRNLKLSPGKMSAQAVHAALGLVSEVNFDYHKCIVLEVSDIKFEQAKSSKCYVVIDAGYTEVKPGTETALAFLE